MRTGNRVVIRIHCTNLRLRGIRKDSDFDLGTGWAWVDVPWCNGSSTSLCHEILQVVSRY